MHVYYIHLSITSMTTITYTWLKFIFGNKIVANDKKTVMQIANFITIYAFRNINSIMPQSWFYFCLASLHKHSPKNTSGYY